MYRRRRAFSRPIVNSIKNVADETASTGTTQIDFLLAKAVNTPLSTVSTDVSQGCIIRALYLSIDVCGLAATGVLQRTGFYLIKNPGDNLTKPDVFSVGTSNEKRFVIKQWSFMTMRNQDGNTPIHWEGWIKIPKKYQRMGTDDTWQLPIKVSTAAGHVQLQCIYKWLR